MLTVTREQKDGITQIRLSGIIDETVDLSKQIGPLPPSVVFVCRDISQINSQGVKVWIEFFSKAFASKIRFKFTECSPVIVEQLNYITNFACGGEVVSVLVPFFCEKCLKEIRGVIKAEDLKRVSYKLPPVQCPKCKSHATIDDVAEEYFAFLIRQNV